ncbi:MAG: hypothetical protein ACLU5J_03890 [Christensenellales bacterium]
MIKKLWLVCFILSIVLTLTSCAAQIEDTNGTDNYDLNTLTDEDFFKQSNVTKFGSVTSKINNQATLKVKKMSGVEVLDKINVSSGNLTIHTNLKITAGNIKLVLIYNDEIIKEFKINEEDSYTGIVNGVYYLKNSNRIGEFLICNIRL